MNGNRKKSIFFFCYALVATAIVVSLSSVNTKRTRTDYLHSLLQQRFTEKESELEQHADSVLALPDLGIPALSAYVSRHHLSDGEFVFYAYEDDHLKSWSSNRISLPTDLDARTNSLEKFQRIDENSVYVYQKKLGTRKVFAIYMLETNFGSSFFDIGIFLPRSTSDMLHVVEAEGEDKNVIYDRRHHPVFSLEIGQIRESDTMAALEELLWLGAFTFLFCALTFLLFSFEFFQKHSYVADILIGIFVIATTTLSIVLRYPLSMHTSYLFSPTYYSFFFPSLGDFLAAMYSMMLICIELYHKPLKVVDYTKGGRLKAFFHLCLADVFFLFVFVMFYNVALNTSSVALPALPLRTPEGESTLMLKFVFSIALTCGILSVHMIFNHVYLTSRLCFHSFREWFRSAGGSALLSGALFGICGLFLFRPDYSRPFIATMIIFYVLVLLTSVYVYKSGKNKFNYYFMVCCLFTTFLLSFVMGDANERRLQSSKESFAQSLKNRNNPVLLYQLRDMAQQLRSDADFRKLMQDSTITNQSVTSYLQEQYLQNLGNYRKKLSVGKGNLQEQQDMSAYRQSFASSVPDSICPDICIFPDMSGRQGTRQSHILMFSSFPIPGPDTFYVALDVEIGSDYFKPAYLLNRSEHRLEKEIMTLSCAEYENGKMTFCRDMRGLFKRNVSDYGLDTLYNGQNFHFGSSEYSVYALNADKWLLIATPQNFIRRNLSTYAYLFIFVILFGYFLRLLLDFPFRRQMFNFQRGLTLLQTVSILVFSLVSSFLFVHFIGQFNKNELFQSTMNRMDMLISTIDVRDLSVDSSDVQALKNRIYPALNRFPKEYVENVNVYSTSGDAVNYLDKNLPIPQSQYRLNPQVIEGIVYRSQTFYIDELPMSLRKDAFILYKPLCNRQGDVVAYFSFPSRQNGGNRERLYFSFIPTFLGVYLFLTVLMMLLGFFFSRYFTSSLTNIANRLSKVSLHAQNQKLSWKHDDEIGVLVNDYNRLVDDLENSAMLLARSERESAWKELAQQVAHEIKNPLTPMKLRTQHLASKVAQGEVTDDYLLKYTHMMSNQIDVLTEIASSFSSLAKIHKGEGREEDLIEIANCALGMYENSEDYTFSLVQDTVDGKASVFVDRQQMLRVYNNLIKNAIQAKRENAPQRVEVKISEADATAWKVEVTDQGKGMDEEARKNAFVPHFTTKFSGTGLGLAIVRNILSDWGGSIGFESEEGKWTRFTFVLPKYFPETSLGKKREN